MLHVKHRDMLMDRDFEPLRWRSLQQRFQLGEVQIVRSRDPFQSKFVFEIIRAEPIGHIERKTVGCGYSIEYSKLGQYHGRGAQLVSNRGLSDRLSGCVLVPDRIGGKHVGRRLTRRARPSSGTTAVDNARATARN